MFTFFSWESQLKSVKSLSLVRRWAAGLGDGIEVMFHEEFGQEAFWINALIAL